MRKFANADETVERMVQVSSIREWLDEKNDKGELVNVTPAVHAALANGTESKDESGRVVAIDGSGIRASIEVANTKVEVSKDGKAETRKYDGEYVALSALTVEGALLLMADVADITVKDDKEIPSVAKYFNQGFGILARNAAAARIRSKVEGPDKALISAAKDLARAKGWTFEKAFARVKAMAAED